MPKSQFVYRTGSFAPTSHIDQAQKSPVVELGLIEKMVPLSSKYNTQKVRRKKLSGTIFHSFSWPKAEYMDVMFRMYSMRRWHGCQRANS